MKKKCIKNLPAGGGGGGGGGPPATGLDGVTEVEEEEGGALPGAEL